MQERERSHRRNSIACNKFSLIADGALFRSMPSERRRTQTYIRVNTDGVYSPKHARAEACFRAWKADARFDPKKRHCRSRAWRVETV